MVEDFEGAVEVIVADDQRRLDADDVGELTADADQDAVFAADAADVGGLGFGRRLLVRSVTNSMPIIRPRPRTSPTRSCLPARSCRPAMKRSPLRAAWPGKSSSSMTSILAEAAAQQIGLPPKVLEVLARLQAVGDLGRGDGGRDRKAVGDALGVDQMSGSTPNCSIAKNVAAATETGLHLVADEEDAVVVEDLLDPRK